MRILRNSFFSCVIDPNHNQWLDGTRPDEGLDQLIQAPFLVCKGRCRVKQVLAVVHIEDGMADRLRFVIARW